MATRDDSRSDFELAAPIVERPAGHQGRGRQPFRGADGGRHPHENDREAHRIADHQTRAVMW
ncbi:hypothetical protein ASF58_05220 [Methylobacterium sp. Leaf125]|nr:hypothetical protein ASF58_05220 [Methylobacterium sp. Leaf125]